MSISLFVSPFPPSSSFKNNPSSITVSSLIIKNQSPTNDTNKVNKNPQLPIEPIKNPNVAIKMPTAPWMKGPLLLHPSEIANSAEFRNKNRSHGAKEQEKLDRALAGKESGVRGKKAMHKIIRKIETLQGNRNSEETQIETRVKFEFGGSLVRIENGGGFDFDFGGKMPWSKDDEGFVLRRMKKEKVVTAAEMRLDRDLLKRLRREAKSMRKWVKVKKAGVTQAVVDEIRMIWRTDELAMVKFDVPLCRNMDRAQEIIELKTGGLVIWCKKDDVVIYRGCHYRFTSKNVFVRNLSVNDESSIGIKDGNETSTESNPCAKGSEDEEPVNGSLYERETDRLLDGLGPRYIDWWMRKPLPVDADMLPDVVRGFKRPLRRHPPRMRAKLNDDELTYYRNLAQSLPFHFVLGRNRGLQGLAAAILKLWEKSLIAKIALKWGVPNINNEQMANELKCLTGGVLILRNKYLIILFRGKDFLPGQVANLVVEREYALKTYQFREEVARKTEIESLEMSNEPVKTSNTGTLSEFQEIKTKFGDIGKVDRECELKVEAEKEKLENELKMQERKLFIQNMKIQKSTAKLLELNSAWTPAEQDLDPEILTDEERSCLREIGFRMRSSLVLGRRGVFDGVIEGLHQHWKHREVVKVITMQRVDSKVLYTAKWLEAQSGGILVSVDKLKEGHAIIIYRGKNYRRPARLMTDNLLNKRKALQRSLEMQRLGSLKFFAYQRKRAIEDLRHRLEELKGKSNQHQEVFEDLG